MEALARLLPIGENGISDERFFSLFDYKYCPFSLVAAAVDSHMVEAAAVASRGCNTVDVKPETDSQLPLDPCPGQLPLFLVALIALASAAIE